MIFSPSEFIHNLKVLYHRHESSISPKVKWWMMSIICLLLLDSSLGISRQLLLNSEIDTIEHLMATKPQIYDLRLVEYKKELLREYTTHETVLDRVVNSVYEKDTGEFIARLLTSAFLPLMLVLVCLYYFAKIILTPIQKQGEHVVNMFFILLVLCLLAYAFLVFSKHADLKSPIVNYCVYALSNIILYLAICWLFSKMRPEG